eukprot:15479075-Alexandrium_andersonii.AAC.1
MDRLPVSERPGLRQGRRRGRRGGSDVRERRTAGRVAQRVDLRLDVGVEGGAAGGGLVHCGLQGPRGLVGLVKQGAGDRVRDHSKVRAGRAETAAALHVQV